MTTVLVVEDEALIAGDIQETLVRLGYDVPVTVGTGHKALCATTEWKPALILMDIKLRGDMDGVEAAAEIRSRLDVPIVYLTSHSDEDTLTRAKATDPHGYLLKPFTERELRTAIEVALHRHQLESKLAERERWFSTTLRSIGDAVVATDPCERITFLNDVAAALTGWGDDAVGRPFSEVFDVVDAGGRPIPSVAGLAIERASSVGLPDPTSLRRRGGNHVSIDDVASPIVDERGVTLGSVVVFRDVTDRRSLEERVSLSERLASVGTLAAGVAHEINNPLSFVIGNLDVCRDLVEKELAGAGAGETIDELQAALVDAQSGAERIRRIVRDLMAFVRGGRGPVGPVDLGRALDDAVKMTDPVVRETARVRRAAGPLPPVLGDDHAFSQVFVNLLLNAAQAIAGFGDGTGEIVVSSATNEAGWAVVEVRDTGPGIPPEVLSRVFDPFFTTKAPGSGTGLGLSICHTIVADAGGSLTAASRPGGGAVFRVALPPANLRSATSAPATSPQTPEPEARWERAAVLVIDDDPSVARAAARILQQEHDVTVVIGGEAALEQLERGERFDAVVCDVRMPGLSGFELERRVRRFDPELARRFVFMTGGPTDPLDEGIAPPPNERVEKPFSATALRGVVHRTVAATRKGRGVG